MTKGPWKLMGVEQNELGLKALRGVSGVNNSWWFLEKFGTELGMDLS